MTNYIPREKLSKKARRVLDAKHRRMWPISPYTKTFKNKKQYSRKRKSCDFNCDLESEDFLM